MGLYAYPSVRGGYNDSLFATNIANDQVSFAKNCKMALEGFLTQRDGTVKVSDTATGASDIVYDIHGFYKHNSDGTITRYTLIKAGTVLYSFNSTTAVFDSVKTGLAATKASMVNFFNGSGAECVVYADGTNFAMWDGSTWTALTKPTSWTTAPKYLEVDDNVLWMAGDSALVYRLCYSESLDPTTIKANSFFEIDSGEGTAITGLKRMENYLLVGKENALHLIIGSTFTDFSRLRVTRNVGVSSHWSIQSVGNVVYFVNNNGIWLGRLRALQEDGMDTELISGNIQRRFQTISAGTHNKISSVYDGANGQIIWAVNSTSNTYYDEAFVLSLWHSDPTLAKPLKGPDPRFVWAGVWVGLKLQSLATVQNSNGVEVVHIGGNDGFVRTTLSTLRKDNCAVGATTGTDIEWEINTIELFFPTTARTTRVKKFYPILFQKHNDSVQVEWVVDQSQRLPVDNTGVADPRTITFTGNVPYWHESTSTDITTQWGTRIWAEKPIIQAQVTLKWRGIMATSILFILSADGTNALDDHSFAGFSVEADVKPARGRG